MKDERSAGGIVLRRTPRGWSVLLIRDMNGTWTFPKGIIEPAESARNAAGREITEETGIRNLAYLGALAPVHYYYRRNGLIRKTVRYFLFEAGGKPRLRPQRDEGISEARWMPSRVAVARIGYPDTNARILAQAGRKFAKLTGPRKGKT